MYFLYSLAKIMFLRGGHALKSLFFAKQFMNIYLEIIQTSITFAPKFKNDMNQYLTTTYNTRNAAWGNKTLCGHFIVHVHWFSGFI